MKIPLQICTRKISLSQSAVAVIKQKVDKLETFCDKIIACRVMVETPHRHKNHGALCNVSIDISIPGGELAVKKEGHEDIYIAIRDAFDAARRQIIQYFNKRHLKYSKHVRNKNQSKNTVVNEEMYADSENILEDYSLNDPRLGLSASQFS